nr:GTP-binding protein 8 isoform X4 [Microcebus murinus]XP_012642955.1 GTP-binding protein 8 isoform X4 [Microcebus murinus]
MDGARPITHSTKFLSISCLPGTKPGTRGDKEGWNQIPPESWAGISKTSAAAAGESVPVGAFLTRRGLPGASRRARHSPDLARDPPGRAARCPTTLRAGPAFLPKKFFQVLASRTKRVKKNGLYSRHCQETHHLSAHCLGSADARAPGNKPFPGRRVVSLNAFSAAPVFITLCPHKTRCGAMLALQEFRLRSISEKAIKAEGRRIQIVTSSPYSQSCLQQSSLNVGFYSLKAKTIFSFYFWSSS